MQTHRTVYTHCTRISDRYIAREEWRRVREAKYEIYAMYPDVLYLGRRIFIKLTSEN